MIITLTRADFSSCKIGTLTTFNVRKSTVIGASVNIIKTSVERAGYSSATTIATIILDGVNYEGHAIKVMMGSTDVSSWYSVGNVIVPKNTPITSNITISVSATAVSGNDPIIPDVPVTPTMYTFTINPTPTNATVTLTADGYTQSGNSISVASGTTISWTVSADGYYDKNGSETSIKDKTLNVILREVVDPEEPGTGGGSVEDETGITWYIDNAAQPNKNFNYTTTFPGAALIAEDKVEALRNVPINVIKFMPSGKPSSGITGKFAFAKLTQGTKPSASDIYYIDIPVEDMYETAPSNDAVARTYILNTPITLNENEYLVMNYVGGTERTAGFWVNAGEQPDYKVGTYDRTNLKTENWGFPFSIGYKS